MILYSYISYHVKNNIILSFIVFTNIFKCNYKMKFTILLNCRKRKAK